MNRSLLALALTLVVAFVMPGVAAAADYEVNVDFDVAPEFGGCNSGPNEECSLPEAIGLANEDGGPSKITFDPALERITFNGSPPAIEAPLTVDGSETDGSPGVEINGQGEGKFQRAFEIKAEGTTIEGVALNTFWEAIAVRAGEAKICNSYIGTDLSGEVAEPNEVGIWIAPGTVGTEIGGEECASGGNVISGNEWVGVLDDGTGTTIAGNLVGVGVGGAEVPNGTTPNPSLPAGGIYARGNGTTVGGIGNGNVIAYNQLLGAFPGGGGVIAGSLSVTVRGNSIFENEGPGIDFVVFGAPPVPTITSASSAEGGSTTIAGSIVADAGESFTVDLYANEVCGEYEIGIGEFAQAGEGEDYLGTATLTTNGSGQGQFTASVPVQPQGTVLTATATRDATGSTSEFSGCFAAPAVTPKPPPAPGEPPVTRVAGPTPENGEKVVVAPKAGTVFVTLPSGKKVKLKEGQTIPVGSIVDATRGKVVLTSINKAGETQTAVFFGGKFLVSQQEGSGLVVLKLKGGDFSTCKAAKGSATASGKSSRKLWGSGKGKFRTEGNNGSATVRGTVWLTEDRCAGTYFKVKQGVVTIRDFGADKTFALPKGKSYLATP